MVIDHIGATIYDAPEYLGYCGGVEVKTAFDYSCTYNYYKRCFLMKNIDLKKELGEQYRREIIQASGYLEALSRMSSIELQAFVESNLFL